MMVEDALLRLEGAGVASGPVDQLLPKPCDEIATCRVSPFKLVNYSMLFLRCVSHFNSITVPDPKSGQYQLADYDALGGEASVHIDGGYEMLSDVFCAHFLFDGKLFVQIDSLQVELTPAVRITASGPTKCRQLCVYVNGNRVVDLTYPSQWAPIEGDLTPFIEEEQFDFGLLLSNIAGSPERQERMKNQKD